MKVSRLTQPPFETSCMGALRGVCDHYGLRVSDAALYGGSGHAFMVNVHEAICPSSPYCWNQDPFSERLANLGIRRIDLGFFHEGSTAEERAAVEQAVRDHVDAGRPCSVINMDHQLILGFDDQRLLLAQPWPGLTEAVTPPTLTFGTWPEFAPECHASFFAYERVRPEDPATIVRAALQFALDVYRTPEAFECPLYGVGDRAWDNWLAAVHEHGATHGNWWNATVWSECRRRASEWFGEIAAQHDADAAALCLHLGAAYGEIAVRLARVAEKDLDSASKAELIQDVKAREAAATEQIASLLGLLRD